MAGRLFSLRRDGRIEVRLNDAGRTAVRDLFVRVVAAERDPNHEWQSSLNAPVSPIADHDDPMLTLTRQNDISSNAELAFVTVEDKFLNSTEAWAWLATLQVALRAIALANGVLSEDALLHADQDVVDEIHLIQQLLFELADCM